MTECLDEGKALELSNGGGKENCVGKEKGVRVSHMAGYMQM